jgi:cytochrome d ubiquinol oxidase subunit I
LDPVFLSRLQFGLTAGFHYIYPQLTIGLSWLIFWIMTRYWRTGEEVYRVMARFWLHVFALGFAIGVATGVVLEFEFGTNWANYSRFVGDIFGAPLAAEGVIAFFLESSFLGMLLFGWNRLSVRTHWFSSLMVAVGATMSAFWIIVANSWQQTPAGFEMVNGRPRLTSFFEAVFNPSTVARFAHVIIGALIAGSFFMLGLSAWFLLKKKHVAFAKESMRLALIVALLASVAQWVSGDRHSVQMGRTQPSKLAAVEGLWESTANAPLLVFAIPSEARERNLIEIPIPGLLSWSVGGSVDAVIQGLRDFNVEDRPPVALVFYSFHFMVGLGLYFLLFAIVGFVLWRRKTLADNRLFLTAAVWSIPLPIIANELGWFTTEVGRQPWIVYQLLRTTEGYSEAVPAAQILASIIFFSVIYVLLFALWVFLLRRLMAHGPEPLEEVKGQEVAS